MSYRESSLVSFAAAHNLTAAEAIYLPSAVAVAAKAVSKSEAEILWSLHNNAAFADYICSAIRQVA